MLLKGNTFNGGIFMANVETLWQQFSASGKVSDYLAYCSAKEGKKCDNDKGTSIIGRFGSERNERRGE